MNHYAIIDKGWVTEIISGGINEKDFPGKSVIEIEKGDVGNIITLQPIVYHNGIRFYQIINKKDIWKRLRAMGLSGKGCEMAFLSIKDIIKFPLIDSDVIIGEPTENKKTFEPMFETEVKPNLKLVLATEQDIDVLFNALFESGLYTEDEAQLYTASWLSDPMVWGVKTIYKDRLLQLEMYHFEQGGKVYAGFQTHFERRLPGWFWKQLLKPLYQSFLTHGVSEVHGDVRKDRRDWADKLKEIYGDDEVRVTDKFITLKHNVKNVLSSIGDWPKRRTVPGWKFEKNGYLVREATGNDRKEFFSLANTTWGNSPRKELAFRILEDDWELCGATFLTVIKDEKVVGCLIIREKEPTVSTIVFPMKRPTYLSDYIEVVHEAEFRWQKEAGYKETTINIETKLLGRGIGAYLEHFGFKKDREWQDVTSFRINLDEALSAYK